MPTPPPNIYNLIAAFCDAHENNRFSNVEAALFLHLVNRLNKLHWQKPAIMSTALFTNLLSVSKPTLCAARNKLKARGIINVDQGVNNSKSPVYTLNYDTSKWDAGASSGEARAPEPEPLTPIGVLERQLVADTAWRQSVAELFVRKYGAIVDMDGDSLIGDFFHYLRCCGVTHKRVADCKSHFINWVKADLKSTTITTKTNNYGTKSNRQPIDITDSSIEEYEADF